MGGLFPIIGFVLLLLCIYLMYVVMGGLDYIHPCILFLSSLFLGEGFSYEVFPLSPLDVRLDSMLYMGT